MRLASSFVLVASLVVGCSGSDTAVAPETIAPAEDASTAPVPSGGDAAPASDAATTVDAADAAVDDRIDPIALGRSWTYDVTIIGTYPLCKAGSHTGQVLGQKVVAGKSAFQVQSFCPGASTSSYAVDGDKVEIYYGNGWLLSLDAPVTEGHTWTDGTTTYAWEKVVAQTVPAGTFDQCWKAKPVVGTSYTTFCRGIGPVRWHFIDPVGNGYDATLTAFVR